MRRATITLPDDLEAAIEAFQRDQSAMPSLAAVTQAALRDFLMQRGYLPSKRVLHITPFDPEDPDPTVSIEHDHAMAEVSS